MSRNSNDKGRAYEYAWIQTLNNKLSEIGKTKIVENSSLDANARAWESMTTDIQDTLKVSASAAVETILELEPLLSDIANDDLILEFLKDGEGIKGDVRDIIIKRDDIEWEIGLSVKHNHEAVKHSRLSYKLDFGNEWFSMPCSNEYWSDVKPIFDMLKRGKENNLKWSELDDKVNDIYIPLLSAFKNEIERAYAKDSSVARKMVEYLIGVKDYYKVVSRDSKKLTIIHTFNMHDTLNKNGIKKVSAITVPVVELPTRIVAIEFKPESDNTIEAYLSDGWQLSFRIHNASTNVEPSLKFDVQFIGMPIAVMSIECRWDEKS